MGNVYLRAYRVALLVKYGRITFAQGRRKLFKSMDKDYLEDYPQDATRYAWYLLEEELDKLENSYS